MKSFEYTIKDEVGLHARPAGMLVSLVKGSGCKVTLSKAEKSADASRLFAVMGLGVVKGDRISVSVSGENEEQTAKELEEFFLANL